MGAEKAKANIKESLARLCVDHHAAPISPMALGRGSRSVRHPLRPRARARARVNIEPAGTTLPRKDAGVERTARSRIRDRQPRLIRNLGWVVPLGERSLPGTIRRG